MDDKRVLIVEDEKLVALDIEQQLKKHGFNIISKVDNGETAVAEILELRPNVILMDINLKGELDGIETTAQLQELVDTPIVFLTAFSDDDTFQKVKPLNPAGFILKPINYTQLISTIELVLNRFTAEQKLIEIKERYNSLFERSLDGIFIFDKDFIITDVNDVFSSILRNSYDELVGKSVYEIIGKENKEKFEVTINELLENNVSRNILQVNLINNEGIDKNLEVNIVKLNIKNRPVSFQAIVQDITPLVAVHNAWGESQKQYRYLYSMMRLMCDNVPDMIWAKDLDKKYLFANKAICENLIFAEDTDEPIGKNDLFFVKRIRTEKPEDPEYHTFGEICQDSDITVMNHKKAERFAEFGNVKGEFLFLDVFKAPFWDLNGNMIGTVGSARDVTKEKEIEREVRRNAEIIKESEEFYRNISQLTSDYFYIAEVQDDLVIPVKVIGTIESATGYTAEELVLGKIKWEDLVLEDDIEMASQIVQNVLNKSKKGNFEYRIKAKNGNIKWMREYCTPIVDEEKNIKKLLGAVQDITEKKKIELSLKKSEERFASVWESSFDGMRLVNSEGKIILVNQAFSNLFETDSEEIIGKYYNIVYLDREDEDIKKFLKRFERRSIPQKFETNVNLWNGKQLWIELSNSFIDVGHETLLLTVFSDITERKNDQEKILASLREKEVLLKEIHHRVKNNLQIISSLLNLQSDSIHDEATKSFYLDSCNRIRTMAIIHEKLYGSNDFTDIAFPSYINDVVASLSKSYLINTRINIKVDVDDISLHINEAIPCGLIINELVSNSIKYAFVGRDEGELLVSLKSKPCLDETGHVNRLKLVVKDNGVGIPESFKIQDSSTLGLQLVESLVIQLDGTVEMVRDNGTEVRIEFNYGK